MVSTEELLRKLGFTSTNSAEYIEHVRSVKYDFLRCDHSTILPGPAALKDARTLLAWETGLNDLYETYPGPGRFSDLGERRTYANFFLVAQAKKARADIALEAKRAAETAEKAKKEVKAKK